MSFEFRKGSNFDAVVVGYCGMDLTPCEATCWPDALDWQNELFYWMNQGYTVGNAFDRANLAFPFCAIAECMRTGGDVDLVFAGAGVQPVVRSIAGEVFSPPALTGFPNRVNYRSIYVREINVPSLHYLDIIATTTHPYVDLAFVNNSSVTVFGDYLYANGELGEVRFVSEQDLSKGMKLTGELRIYTGGEIIVYE
jgi:hypothetical protein